MRLLQITICGPELVTGGRGQPVEDVRLEQGEEGAIAASSQRIREHRLLYRSWSTRGAGVGQHSPPDDAQVTFRT